MSRIPFLCYGQGSLLQCVGDDCIRYVRANLFRCLASGVGDITILGFNRNTLHTVTICCSGCAFCLFCKAVDVLVSVCVLSRERILLGVLPVICLRNGNRVQRIIGRMSDVFPVSILNPSLQIQCQAVRAGKILIVRILPLLLNRHRCRKQVVPKSGNRNIAALFIII